MNTSEDLPVDLGGNVRRIDTPVSDVGSTCPVVDMGGYENQNICVAD